MAEKEDTDTTALLTRKWPTEPESYLYHDEMISRPLDNWLMGIEKHEKELGGWFITKVEHMKSFHFSSVMHEYLRVTVERLTPDPEPSSKRKALLFAEREYEDDEITVGWEKVRHPELTGWWIVRLFRGYFSGPNGGGVPFTASSSAIDSWRAVGYSASDFLCELVAKENSQGLPLKAFAEVLRETNAQKPVYHAQDANCFWFAETVYKGLQRRTGDGTVDPGVANSAASQGLSSWWTENRGGYYHHKGKFGGVRWLPFQFRLIPAIRDYERFSLEKGSNLPNSYVERFRVFREWRNKRVTKARDEKDIEKQK
ncbi:uncharacterized protein LTHEOB_8128 [Lasiodiplodia theobromae]|uniref:Uncharacterized protein n=1 Tax=Lasiodiplodia theobromae TaxID=45133 RepID=A0A5N5DBV3_9PEZI|nr:uncharacterized protein LTHEOB_8128 [Lasiodiplodia theobromae]KAB2575219.1 hypothetical protein DBV05_g6135 [Lasiodiplodia theobromae]KAF4541974.1 hypothetical protein LTHEOB_8128 [Lasiodiplodia theobromae]